MTLWLVGMMGSGKSAVGRKAAELAGATHLDLDEMIEERLGVTIHEFWSKHGEGEFRRIEVEALRELAGRDAIVSTGGGAVLDTDSRQLMKSTGKVVWLVAEPELLASRVDQSELRPLLTRDNDVSTSLRKVLDARQHLYEEVADVRIDTDHAGIDTVAGEVVKVWQS